MGNEKQISRGEWKFSGAELKWNGDHPDCEFFRKCVMNQPPMEVDCRHVKGKLDAGEKFLLLDCREQSEYDTVKIAGAVLVPMSQIQERVGELEAYKEGPVVVHCHHGGRSLRVANWLRGQGYLQAQSMAGGIDDWAVQIDPSLPRY